MSELGISTPSFEHVIQPNQLNNNANFDTQRFNNVFDKISSLDEAWQSAFQNNQQNVLQKKPIVLNASEATINHRNSDLQATKELFAYQTKQLQSTTTMNIIVGSVGSLNQKVNSLLHQQ